MHSSGPGWPCCISTPPIHSLFCSFFLLPSSNRIVSVINLYRIHSTRYDFIFPSNASCALANCFAPSSLPRGQPQNANLKPQALILTPAEPPTPFPHPTLTQTPTPTPPLIPTHTHNFIPPTLMTNPTQPLPPSLPPSHRIFASSSRISRYQPPVRSFFVRPFFRPSVPSVGTVRRHRSWVLFFFPPSKHHLQAMRTLYGHDFGSKDFPDTPAACWALVVSAQASLLDRTNATVLMAINRPHPPFLPLPSLPLPVFPAYSPSSYLWHVCGFLQVSALLSPLLPCSL